MEVLQFLNNHFLMTIIFTGALGLVIGSFLNVVIYRYPIMLENNWREECLEYLELPAEKKEAPCNIVTPRSHCPKCKAQIKAWQNIPIISYLILRGKCANCKTPISTLYPFVELLSAITAIIVVAKFGISIQSLVALLLTWSLIAMSFIDIKEQILPDTMTLSLLWLGLFASLIGITITPYQAILGAIGGYAMFWAVAQLFKLIRNKDGMGHGDFKMLAMLGAWLGIQNLLNVVLIAALLGTIVGIILISMKKMSREIPLPFGPFLAIGGWLTLLFGNMLNNFLTKLIL